MKNHITPNLMKIARLFKKKGDLYIVGGYVRNAILGTYETDIDLASRLTNDEIKEILFGTQYQFKEISKKLGTCVISLGEEKWEHSTFRKEVYSEDGEHSPIAVEFINDIQEDAKRRDFTCNAIYYNILKGDMVDFYNGIADTKKHVIRTIGSAKDVLSVDGLRILRMVRLATELGFKINGETLLTAYELRDNLGAISGARKYDELKLILDAPTRYSSNSANCFMFGLQMFNLLKLWKFYNSPVLKIRLKFVKNAEPENRFLALILDIISSCNLKNDKAELVNQLLGKQGLCLPDKKIEDIKHVICGYYSALEKMENKAYFMEYFEDFKIIRGFLSQKSKKLFKKYNFFYNYLINNKIPIRLKDLKISGNDIKEHFPKIKDKYYKTILNELLSRVFDGLLKNEKATLLQEVTKIKA